MRCSARRRRAAATISIARVIFWMFLTEAIRFLTSLSAMAYLRLAGGHGARLALVAVGVLALASPAVVLGAAAPAAFLGADVVVVLERVALFVEVVAEVVGELLDRLAQ